MEKITLTSVQRYTTKKDGTALIGKNGKPYTSVRVKCNEYGDQFLSGFGNKENEGWKAGDTVEVIVTKNGEYLNFEVPKKDDKLDAKYEELANKITGIILRLNAIEAHLKPKPVVDDYPVNPTDGIDPADLPF